MSDALSLMNFEQVSTTQIHSSVTTTLGTLAGQGLTAAASSFFASVNGYIETDSSAGNHPFAILVASDTSSATVTINAGSWCTVQ
jgi:hypothetical protein